MAARPTAISFVALAVIACAGAESASPSRSVPATASSAPATPVSVSPPVSDLVAPVETTDFQLFAVGDDLQLTPLGQELFVTAGCQSGGPFASARITHDGLELSTALTEGSSFCPVCACNFQGWSPDHIFKAAPREGPGDGCTTHDFRVKRGKSWHSIGGPGGGFLVVSLWSRGRKLVLGQDCGRRLQIAALDASDKVIRAADAPSVGPELGTVAAFAAFPSGEAMVLSMPEGTEAARVSVWRDGKRKPKVFPLPDAAGEWRSASMVAHSPTDVVVGASTSGGPYLASFDGSAWTRLAVSGPKDIDLIRPATGGGVWLVGPGPRLWRRGPSGAFDSISMPSGFVPLDIVEWGYGDVWLVSDRELYSTRRVPRAVQIVTDCPGIFQNAAEGADFDLERCKPRLESLKR